MKECLSQQDMEAFVDGDAPVHQHVAWGHHLRICDPCATQVTRLRAGIEPVLQRAEDGDTRTDHSSRE